MRRLTIRTILGVATVAAVQGAAPMRIEQLDWLAGCWSRESGGRLIEEQWMVPRGGLMLGMGRTTEGGATREWEATRIEERDGALVFTAHPSGQSEASFTAIELGARRVVFSNPSHDFPQRVLYMLQEDGNLLGRVEGERNGKLRGEDFPYERVRCPGPEAAGPD